jgi:putative endonuclease
MRVKDAVGRFGEQLAADHLERAGLTILDRNWRCREGELDIVARDGDELVFVEVKTRSSPAFGTPAQAVNRAKTARIRRLAVRYLLAKRAEGLADSWTAMRFDVVAVVRTTPSGPEVVHLKGVF